MKILSKKLYALPISEKNIDMGWYHWINDDETTKFLTVKPPVLKDDLYKYINKNIDDNNILYAVYLCEDNKYIGNFRIYNIDSSKKSAMYGRLIGIKNLRNKGYGSEIVNMICTLAFCYCNLNLLYTRILESNSKSKFSNKKIGKVIARSSKFWNDQKQKLEPNEIGFLILKNNWLESLMKKEFNCTLVSKE